MERIKIKNNRNSKLNNSRKLGSVITVLFCIFLMVVTVLGKFPYQIIGVYFATSLVTFCTCAFDKSAAKNNRWRVKENTLHLFGMIGGWPGAFYAQNKLRHKSNKSNFKKVFWITVIINLAIFCWLFTEGGSQFLKLFIEM